MNETNLSKAKREILKNKINMIRENSDDEIVSILNEIENEIENKIYGLVWEEHSENVDKLMEVKIPVFTEVVGKEVVSNSEDGFNFILEGDNLHSLKLLEKTHRGNVDVVYIDPPYNTGASKWKYNNNYIDGNDIFKHSKWISMMNRRLKIAKSLMKDDGVLICAIDENEIATLKLLLEDLFGSMFQVDVITIVQNPRGIQGDNFSYTNEFALFVYRKSYKVISEKEVEEQDIEWNPLRNWGSESLRTDARNCFYGIRVKDNVIVGFDDVLDESIHPEKNTINKNGETVVYPIDQSGIERKWRYARQSVESILPLLRVVERKGIFDIEIGKNFAPYKSVWVDKKYDANEYGTQLINSMVPNNDFDFPKSLWNVYECLYATLKNKPDSIVVDFFAGSGTTGHAVEMLNKLLGGTRKYILATNNAIGENKEKEFSKLFGKVEDYPNEYSAYEEKYGICSSITYPRMLAVNNGYVHTKDTKDVLFEKKFSKRVFDSIDQIKLEIDIIIQKFEGRYEKIDYVFENDCIKLIGIHKKGESVPGIPHNIKYYKTDFIDKVKDGTVTNSLLDHIKELIQLEHGFKIDDEKIVMVLNEDDLDLRFTRDLSKCQSLFKPSFVQLTLPQKQQLNNLNITPIDIPEYYFRNELMEVEEL